MRTQSSRAILLSVCAFALAGSLPISAAETKPNVPASAPPLSTAQGKKMAAELGEFEKTLIKSLKGEDPLTFKELDSRYKDLKRRIDAAALVPGDRKILDIRLARLERVLERCLRRTGNNSQFDLELSKAVAILAATKDPLSRIGSLLGELDQAFTDPASADLIFDNLKLIYRTTQGKDPVNFKVIQQKLAATWSFTPKGAPGTNAATASDLARAMPAPAASVAKPSGRAAAIATALSFRVTQVNTDGTIEYGRFSLPKGTSIVKKSAHINQLLEKGPKNIGWEVDLRSLLNSSDDQKRLRIARELAHEVMLILGLDDDSGRRSNALGSFLAAEANDADDLIDPNQGSPIRFFINAKRNYMLIFTRRDGTKRILSGTFNPATRLQDKADRGIAFGVSGEIIVDSVGTVRQTDPTIKTEYLADGSRLVWSASSSVYTPKTNVPVFGPREMWYTNERGKTEFSVRHDIPPDTSRAKWNADGKTWLSSQDTIDRETGKPSVLGEGAQTIANFPLAKQVFGLFGDFASTVYTGVISGGQIAVTRFGGYKRNDLEATAGFSRNPLMKFLLVGAEPDHEKDPKAWRTWKDKLNAEHLARIGGGNNQMILAAQARERREKALTTQGITERRAPQARRDALEATLSDDERYDAFSDFGAGTYDRALAKNGYSIFGGAMAGAQIVGESIVNPLIVTGPVIGKISSYAGTTGNAVLLVSRHVLLDTAIASFAVSALDSTGKVFDFWGTPDFAIKTGESLADIAFAKLMFDGARKMPKQIGPKSLAPATPVDAPTLNKTVSPQSPVSVVEAAPKTTPSTLRQRALKLWNEFRNKGGDAFSDKSGEKSVADQTTGSKKPSTDAPKPKWHGIKPPPQIVGPSDDNPSDNDPAPPMIADPQMGEDRPADHPEPLADNAADTAPNDARKKIPDPENPGKNASPSDNENGANNNVASNGNNNNTGTAPKEGNEESSGKVPKAPKFGGFGEGGGGGGGGGGGAGGGGTGGASGLAASLPASLPDNLTSGNSAQAGPVADTAQPAAPPRGSPASLGNPSAKTALNDTASIQGGHSPDDPTPASRSFDRAQEQSGSAKTSSPPPMKGLSGGESPWLPRLTVRSALVSPPAAEDEKPFITKTSALSIRPAKVDAPSVKPEAEDFGYTPLASPQYQYELPTDRPVGDKDRRSSSSLGLSCLVSMAIVGLCHYTDLPYLIGFTRRRRDGTYGA